MAAHTEEGTSHLSGEHHPYLFAIYLFSHHLYGAHTVYEGYTTSVGFIVFMWVALLYGSSRFTKFEWSCSNGARITL